MTSLIKRENAKEVWIEKRRGEALGVALVEYGWGSILPTVILGTYIYMTSLWRHHRFWWSKMLMSALFWPLTPMKCIFSERGLQNIKNEGSNVIRGYFVEKLWRNPILTDFDDVIIVMTSLWRHQDHRWDKFGFIVNFWSPLGILMGFYHQRAS